MRPFRWLRRTSITRRVAGGIQTITRRVTQRAHVSRGNGGIRLQHSRTRVDYPVCALLWSHALIVHTSKDTPLIPAVPVDNQSSHRPRGRPLPGLQKADGQPDGHKPPGHGARSWTHGARTSGPPARPATCADELGIPAKARGWRGRGEGRSGGSVDIAWLLADGASDRQISRELGISERTVSNEVRETAAGSARTTARTSSRASAATRSRSRAARAAWGRAASPWPPSRAGRGAPAGRAAPRCRRARSCPPRAAANPHAR